MTKHKQGEDRRKFTRVPFEASVTLSNPEGSWTGKLQDISLNGVLISRPHNWLKPNNSEFLVEIHPTENSFYIRMEATVTHLKDQNIGLRCDHIDIDSASHLKRLVELNIGDEAILNRELSALLSHAA